MHCPYSTRATWYSARQPSRPIQFISQDPNYRQPFWGFPHASISPTVTTALVSSLYDSLINASVNSLAAAALPTPSVCPSVNVSPFSETLTISLFALSGFLGVVLIVVTFSYWCSMSGKYSGKSSPSDDKQPYDVVTNSGDDVEDLQRTLIN